MLTSHEKQIYKLQKNVVLNPKDGVGGGGGGRPNMAQAGGKNPAGIEDAILQAEEVLKDQLQ